MPEGHLQAAFPAAIRMDAMAQLSGSDLDDLSNLFEFGDIDLNNLSAITEAEEYGSQLGQPHHVTHPATPFADINQACQLGAAAAQDFDSDGQGQYGLQHAPGQFSAGGPVGQQMAASHPFPTEAMYQPAMQHSFSQPNLQQFQYAHQPTGFPSGSIVPPTPNSFDMHGEAGRFLQQQQQQQFGAPQQALLEQRYQLRKDDAIALTPMVSPAGTPQYHVAQEYALPGAYFSPLTSPMLHAQQQSQQPQQHLSGYTTNPSTAASSNATSPIDPNVDVDMLGGDLSLPESASSRPKRPRKKPATTPRSAATAGKTWASPYVKPQKRKSGSMLASSMQSGDAVMQDASGAGLLSPGPAGLQTLAALMGSSEDGSISPEPLSESVMGPPPRPGSSVNQSPAIAGRQGKSAATPKSILSKSSDKLNGADEAREKNGTVGLEDLQLPAAARQEALRPSLTTINTQAPSGQSSNEPTPRLAARKTPKLGPESSPSTTSRPGSSVIGPSVMASPSSATTPGGILKDRRSDSKNARPHKKRGSVSASHSSMASPALRPKISPSIKPLLPEGSKFSRLHCPQIEAILTDLQQLYTPRPTRFCSPRSPITRTFSKATISQASRIRTRSQPA